MSTPATRRDAGPAPALAAFEAARDRLPDHPLLDPLREAGWQAFSAAGFPGRRDEDWKYTGLRPIERRGFAFGAPAELPGARDLESLAIDGLDGARIVFVNGKRVPELSRPPEAAGLTVNDLADGLAADPGLPGLADAGRHRFAALNQAFLGDGTVIRVARDARPEAPVTLMFVTTAGAGPAACHPRVVIELAENARLTLIEHYVGLGEPENLTNSVTEISVARGAGLTHYLLQEQPASAFHIGGIFARLEADARLVSHNLQTGAALARIDLEVGLAAPGASAGLYGLYAPGGSAHVDNHTRVDHLAEHTTSRQVYRGILDGKARAVFNGKALVHPGAQKTDAHQSNDNLLLSRAAEVDTKPELEIYADDVKCSHGATVGQLDETALFYLRSRGIPEATARGMLTFGFAETVIATMDLEPLRRRLERSIAGGLPVLELTGELS